MHLTRDVKLNAHPTVLERFNRTIYRILTINTFVIHIDSALYRFIDFHKTKELNRFLLFLFCTKENKRHRPRIIVLGLLLLSMF